jgi:hypothetical protein
MIITPNERGVLLNVMDYALKNWGDRAEEIEISKLMIKISKDQEFRRSEVILLNRVFSLICKLFSSNKELAIDGMHKLGMIINKMDDR